MHSKYNEITGQDYGILIKNLGNPEIYHATSKDKTIENNIRLYALYLAIQPQEKDSLAILPVYLQHIPAATREKILENLKEKFLSFTLTIKSYEESTLQEDLYEAYLEACDALENFGSPFYSVLAHNILSKLLAILATAIAITAFFLGLIKNTALTGSPYFPYLAPLLLVQIGLLIVTNYKSTYSNTRNLFLSLQDKKIEIVKSPTDFIEHVAALELSLAPHMVALALALAISLFSAVITYNLFLTLGALGLSASLAVLIAQLAAGISLINSFIKLYPTIYNFKIQHVSLFYLLINRTYSTAPSHEAEKSLLEGHLPHVILNNFSFWVELSDILFYAPRNWIWVAIKNFREMPWHIPEVNCLAILSMTYTIVTDYISKGGVAFPTSIPSAFEAHNRTYQVVSSGLQGKTAVQPFDIPPPLGRDSSDEMYKRCKATFFKAESTSEKDASSSLAPVA